MLNPDQFSGAMLPADRFHGSVRDLTSARLSTRSRAARDRADVYRSAIHAYNLEMEKHAIGYETEEREYRQQNPPPTWRGFLKEGFGTGL